MKTDYKGIDYSLGRANIDKNGIRYGVINQNAVGQVWYDESVPFYGDCECSNCGNMVDLGDDICPNCDADLYNEFDFIEPLGFEYIDDEYHITSDEYGDLFVLKSPYYTYAQFCSPCAPGAVHLENPLDGMEENNKGYCLGLDWFEDGIAPYPIYEISTGNRIIPLKEV